MSDALLTLLIRGELALTVGVLLVLALRRSVRRTLGPLAAYALWLVAPQCVIAALLPAAAPTGAMAPVVTLAADAAWSVRPVSRQVHKVSLELMMETWHGKGDGSFAAIQRNRARTLNLIEQAAARGEVGGLSMLATYIRGGRHQYPIDPDLGRRLALLCLRASGAGCREELLTSLPAPVDNYALLADLARTQPVRFAARRDAAWARLTPEQQARSGAAAVALRRAPWAELAPEWAVVRARIIAQGDPASVSCLPGHLNSRPN